MTPYPVVVTTADTEPVSGHAGMLLAAPDTGTDTVLGSRYRALTLAMVSVVLLIAFEATAVGTAMPIAARELDGLQLYAFAFSGYFTTSLFAMVVSGQWSDRTGPLAPLVAGIGAFAAGLVVSGTAQSMWPFVLGRAVQGIGGGLVIVALYVVVGLAYPERLRPAVMAAFAASWVLPSIVGPLVAGTVTEQFGWRWVFLAIPALVVLPLLIGMPALRRTSLQRPPDDRRAPDRQPARPGARRLHAAPGCSSTPGRICGRCPWSSRWRAPCSSSRPRCGCCPAAPSARPADCRRWCCCAVWPPARSSAPRASSR